MGKKLELESGETQTGNWAMFEESSRGRIGGNLITTDRRILFQETWDASVGKIAEGEWDKASGLTEIKREDLRDVKVEKSFFRKKVLVKAANGVTYHFDRGMMSIDAVADAIKG